MLKEIIAHAKEYGFVFPSSEIYDGLAATYDYGPMGVQLKRNLKQYWWTAMTRYEENIEGLDSAIFMHPKTWKASGHVDAFNDPLIDNKDSKKRYRADVLIEDHIEKWRQKIAKEITKAGKRFGDSFDQSQFEATNPRILKYRQEIATTTEAMTSALETNNMGALKQLIEDLGIACAVSGTRNWTDVRQFNLMFSTQMGAVAGDDEVLYLRPETAQGIFVNFLNVQKTTRKKLPFGIAQIGKAFRNEIVARQFIFRQKEFEQMEMQFFVPPGEEMEYYEYWKNQRLKWHLSLGLGREKYRFHDHANLAHYANAATDIEFDFPFGFKELEGIHSRTDFDLKAHEEVSKKKLRYFDPERNESYVPYVVETSVGLDRLFLSVLSAAYEEEKLEDGSSRTVLRLPAPIAPLQIGIFPLTKKEGMPEQAEAIYKKLKTRYACTLDVKDSIGKRYRRADAIGIPFCITIDQESANDHAVTVRYRDTMQQERISIEELDSKFAVHLSTQRLLDQLS